VANNLDRTDRERNFHDRFAATIDPASINIEGMFESSTAPENRFILARTGDLNGKTILDLGCGAGESSVFFARKGAHCYAADCSQGMIALTRKLAALHGVEIIACLTDAGELPFENNIFDIVYAANLLHHVDVQKTLREIYRVLKPGGKACTWDPLRHNPLINLYRLMATDVRTPDEHPLDISIIGEAQKMFTHVVFDTFWLATLWLLCRFYLVEHVDPNHEPYWRKIHTEEPRLRKTYLRLAKIDTLLKKIPLLKKYAWNIVVVAEK
jgi:SAM-dependent methyltransferase